MLTTVIEQLAAIVEDGLKGTIPGDNIILYHPLTSHNEKVNTPPLVAIYDSGFKIEEIGLGSGVAESNEEIKEEFSGDGKKTVFKLRKRLLKPIIRVEYPTGTPMKSPDDFTIDYSRSSVIFRSPPAKGDNNIVARYAIARTVGEIRSLRLAIRCHIDVWAQDMITCDIMMSQTMKAILLSTEKLLANGIRISPIEGVNTTGSNDDNSTAMIFGRRLIYLAEVDVRAEQRVPPIEKIDVVNRTQESIH